MGTKVEDLLKRIRAGALATERAGDQSQQNGSAAAEFDLVVANLAVARRAQDQLPPIKSYRRGLIARIELWLKTRVKRVTRWFTWEQANFNTATAAALDSILTVLVQLNRGLEEIRTRLEQSTAESAMDSDLNSRLAALETDLQALFMQIAAQGGETKQIELVREEQLVCFRQLALQVTEVAVVSDRMKRNLQKQLDELAHRVGQLEEKQARIPQL